MMVRPLAGKPASKRMRIVLPSMLRACAAKNGLAAAGGKDGAAFSGALCLEGITEDGLFKPAGEENHRMHTSCQGVIQSSSENPAAFPSIRIVKREGEAKGIPLDVIDGENIRVWNR